MMEEFQCKYPAIAGWCPLGTVSYQGSCLSLQQFSAKIEHLAVSIARSALLSEVHDAEPMDNLCFCRHGYLFMSPWGNDKSGWRSSLILPSEWIILST